jgi:hypothetical protein
VMTDAPTAMLAAPSVCTAAPRRKEVQTIDD